MRQNNGLTIIHHFILSALLGQIFAPFNLFGFIYSQLFLRANKCSPGVPYPFILSNDIEWLTSQIPGAGGDGNSFASGVYFYTLIANEFTQTKKLILLK